MSPRAQKVFSELLQLKRDSPEELQQIIEALHLSPDLDRDAVPFVTLRILRKHAPELQKNLQLHILIPYLLSAELLTQDEEYTLTNPNFPLGERIRILVSFIAKKGPEGPRRLLRCIRRSVIEHGLAAGGNSYVYELLSRGMCPTEQMVNSEQERRHIQQLERQRRQSFATLVAETWKKLVLGTCKEVEEELKVFICAYTIRSKLNIREEIEKAKSMREIFVVLNNSECWSYTDTELLESIIKAFCDKEMIEKMEAYMKEVTVQSATESVCNSPPLKHKVNLRKKYANLVRFTQKEFRDRQIEITELRVYTALLPTVLPVQYSHFDQEDISALENADISTLLTTVVGYYSDYKGYQLLQCLVDRFGSMELKQAFAEYAEDFSKAMPEHSLVPSQATEEVIRLKKTFANIVIKFLKFLQNESMTTCTFQVFRDHFSKLPACTVIPEKKMLISITAANCWCTLFLGLTHTWDFLSCRILQNALEKYGNDELNQDFAAYLQQRSNFLKITTPIDLFAVLPNCQPPARMEYTKVSLQSSSSKWEEDNMEYYETFVSSLTSEFGLQPHSVVMYNIELNKSLSKLHFYLPTSVAGLLLIVDTERKARFYHRHKISHVEMKEDGQYYFDIDLTKSSPKDMFMLASKNQDLIRRLQLTELKSKL